MQFDPSSIRKHPPSFYNHEKKNQLFSVAVLIFMLEKPQLHLSVQDPFGLWHEGVSARRRF